MNQFGLSHPFFVLVCSGAFMQNQMNEIEICLTYLHNSSCKHLFQTSLHCIFKRNIFLKDILSIIILTDRPKSRPLLTKSDWCCLNA